MSTSDKKFIHPVASLPTSAAINTNRKRSISLRLVAHQGDFAKDLRFSA
jgi:hypothetical protein